jgi:hypothetical protein
MSTEKKHKKTVLQKETTGKISHNIQRVAISKRKAGLLKNGCIMARKWAL